MLCSPALVRAGFNVELGGGLGISWLRDYISYGVSSSGNAGAASASASSDNVFGFALGGRGVYEIPLSFGGVELGFGASFRSFGGMNTQAAKEFAMNSLRQLENILDLKGLQSADTRRRFYGLSFPVVASLCFDVSPLVGLYVGTGLQPSVGLAGSIETTLIKDGGKQVSKSADLDWAKEPMKRFSLDWKLEGGVRVNRVVKLGFYYNLGITPISQVDEKQDLFGFKSETNAEVRARSFGLSLAYILPLR